MINERNKIDEYASIIKDGGVIIFKEVWPKEHIKILIKYLINVASNTIPNYHAISPLCPNFHLLNRNDKRSYVKGCFQQFNFFPWNHDYFNLFNYSRKIFIMKNIISGLDDNAYLGDENEFDRDFTARIAFQFYPSGSGFLNIHKDPVNIHQTVLPILIMSLKGDNYNKGGGYFEIDGKKIYYDESCNIGDLLFFSPDIPHGVELIDPDTDENWLSFNGRWSGLLSINKFSESNKIPDSIDLKI